MCGRGRISHEAEASMRVRSMFAWRVKSDKRIRRCRSRQVCAEERALVPGNGVRRAAVGTVAAGAVHTDLRGSTHGRRSHRHDLRERALCEERVSFAFQEICMRANGNACSFL